MRLPWLGGLSSLYCLFYHSFLISYGVDKLLGLRSLYLAFSLGWVLFGHRSFLLQSSPCLLCGLANTFAMSRRYFCHVIIWLMLAVPLLGLLYSFLLLSSNSPVLSLSMYSHCFGLFWRISSLWGFLGPFYSFGQGFLLSLLNLPGPNYHTLYSRGLWAFPPAPFT